MFHGSTKESYSSHSQTCQRLQQSWSSFQQDYTRFPTIITIWDEIICVCASHLSWGAPTDLCPKFCAQAKLAFLRPAALWYLARGTPFACDRPPMFVLGKFSSKTLNKNQNHFKLGSWSDSHHRAAIGSRWKYSYSNYSKFLGLFASPHW